MREDWLAKRRTGIGGSDAPAVAGLGWRTPREVWEDKRGLLPVREVSPAMAWGTRLEPVIRDAYAEATGRLVRVPTDILRHPDFPYMIGTIDGVTDDGRLLEVKTARSDREWGEAGTGDIPLAYLIQVQHYLTVTALSVADVAVLIGGQDFRIYEVPADAGIQAMLRELEGAFWARVQSGEPPDPQSLEDVKRAFPASVQKRLQASTQDLERVQLLRETRGLIQRAEADADRYQAELMNTLRDADTLVDGDRVLATWKQTKGRKMFNLARLEAEKPDLYAEYTMTLPGVRRFLLKVTGDEPKTLTDLQGATHD